MVAQILNGKALADEINTRLKHNITKLQRHPCLAVIQLGNESASSIYVNNKLKACLAVGIDTRMLHLDIDTTQQQLCKFIDDLNHDDTVDGILVQLPLPKHINLNNIIERISIHKDVDGFHPYNLGKLFQGKPTLRPCTSYGIMQLLTHYKYSFAGKHAVVVGVSNHVGRPMALELLLAHATVTQCHSQTHNLQHHVEAADLLIIATGNMQAISTEWLQPHQVIIDVGIHRLTDGSIRGDIDYAHAKEKVNWITPVPGGVGPMTISVLLQNVVQAYQGTLSMLSCNSS